LSDISSYITVKTENISEITEKRSRFIARAMNANTEEEALSYIEKIKANEREARHNCFAFITEQGKKIKCSDDGDPQGTAGVPILDVIKKSGVTNTVIVVTRYFGGILLGAGGLVRAYSSAASLVLKGAVKDVYTEKVFFKVVMNYDDRDKYSNVIKRAGAVEKKIEFAEKVTVEAFIKKDKYPALAKEINEIFAGRLNAETITAAFTPDEENNPKNTNFYAE